MFSEHQPCGKRLFPDYDCYVGSNHTLVSNIILYCSLDSTAGIGASSLFVRAEERVLY